MHTDKDNGDMCVLGVVNAFIYCTASSTPINIIIVKGKSNCM